MKNLQPFTIDHIDALGQGVSKHAGTIGFIEKTLPGESGICEITGKKGKVFFASPVELSQKSSQRISPECPHYETCSGCHYLHTDYASEMNFKLEALTFKLNSLKELKRSLNFFVESIAATNRFHYRSRMQLHYSDYGSSIGFQNRSGNGVTNARSCKLYHPDLKELWKEIYENSKFQEEKGIIELFLDDQGTPQFILGRGKSGATFSQVNRKMNSLAKSYIEDSVQALLSHNSTVLDLFGGSGNLCSHLAGRKIVVDNYPEVPPKKEGYQFFKINLYRDKDFQDLFRKVDKEEVDLCIINPPRSGLKNIDKLFQNFRPEKVVYMSCNAATLIRDLEKLSGNYQLEKMALVDFFPGTYHFETIAVLG